MAVVAEASLEHKSKPVSLIALSEEIDKCLTLGTFGNSDTILKARWAMYELLLRLIAEKDGIKVITAFLSRPTNEWRTVFDDPLLRIRFHEAYGIFRCGHSIANTDFARLMTIHYAHFNSANVPLVVHALGDQGVVGNTNLRVLMNDSGSNANSITEEFLSLFRSEVLVNRLTDVVRDGTLLQPNDGQRKRIELAYDLLCQILPNAILQATRHATLIALAEAYTLDAEMGSGTARSVPGMIFISSREMDSVWTLAEAMLHELSHCKLFDLYLGRRIFHSNYDVHTANTILSPWNVHTEYQSNEWPFDQAFAAFHVYVHLAAFKAGLNNIDINFFEQKYGKIIINESLSDASARARYLGAQIIRHADTHLSEDGINLITWLGRILDSIDSIEFEPARIKYFNPIEREFKVCPFSTTQSPGDDITLVLRHDPPELLLVDPLPFELLNVLNSGETVVNYDQFFIDDIPSISIWGNLLSASDELYKLHLIEINNNSK